MWQIDAHVKSVAVSSCASTRKLMTTGFKALGIPVRGQTRNLGVDHAPGKRARRRVVLMSRWKQVKIKAKRCRMIGSAGASVVGRIALLPAVSYGASCSSVASGFLKDLKVIMVEANYRRIACGKGERT